MEQPRPRAAEEETVVASEVLPLPELRRKETEGRGEPGREPSLLTDAATDGRWPLALFLRPQAQNQREKPAPENQRWFFCPEEKGRRASSWQEASTRVPCGPAWHSQCAPRCDTGQPGPASNHRPQPAELRLGPEAPEVSTRPPGARDQRQIIPLEII